MMLAPLLILAAAAQAATPAPADDPLAPARAGKLRCVEPNPAKRNCAAIIRFQVRDDGSFDATVSGFLERAPEALIVYRISGRTEGQAVCALVRMSDFTSGRIFVAGKPATPAQARAIESRLLTRMSEVTGKRRCFIDQPDRDGIVTNVTINGIVRPEMRQRVAWVDPGEGYAIGD